MRTRERDDDDDSRRSRDPEHSLTNDIDERESETSRNDKESRICKMT